MSCFLGDESCVCIVTSNGGPFKIYHRELKRHIDICAKHLPEAKRQKWFAWYGLRKVGDHWVAAD